MKKDNQNEEIGKLYQQRACGKKHEFLTMLTNIWVPLSNDQPFQKGVEYRINQS